MVSLMAAGQQETKKKKWKALTKRETWGNLLYYLSLRRPPDKTSASYLFNPQALKDIRPELVIESGGTYESHNFNPGVTIETKAKRRKEDSFMHVYLLAVHYVLFIIIGVSVGTIGGIIEFISAYVSCIKNSTLRTWVNQDYADSPLLLLAKSLGLNLPFAFVGSVIVAYIKPQAAAGGVAGILGHLNGVNVVGLLDFDVLFVKALSLICMSCANLPGGMQGPMIHIGSIVASSLPRIRFPYSRKYIFPDSATDIERRDFISAGVAAGLAAAIGTPTGCMLMAMEEFVQHWNLNMAFKIYICSFCSGTAFNYFSSWSKGYKGIFLGSSVLFLQEVQANDTYQFSITEIPVMIAVGFGGALIGSFWVMVQAHVDLLRRKYLKYRCLKVVEVLFWCSMIIVADIILVTAFPQYCSPKPVRYSIKIMCSVQTTPYDMKLSCKDKDDFASAGMFAFQEISESYDVLFHPNVHHIHFIPLVYYFVAFFLISAMFCGSSIASGVYWPGLYVGAIYGRMVAIILHTYTNNVSATRLAFVGSGSVLCGIIRLTFSLAAIMCEGSSNTIVFIPLLIAIFTSRLIADLIIPSIYEVHHTILNIPMLGRCPPPLCLNATVKDIMANPVVCLPIITNVGILVEAAFKTRHNGFPIVNKSFITQINEMDSMGRLEGLILRSNILQILRNLWFENPPPEADTDDKKANLFRKDYADIIAKNASVSTRPNPVTNVDLTNYVNFHPARFAVTGSVSRAYKVFITIGLRHLIVINSANEVIGMITRKDLARFRRKESLYGVLIKRRVYT